MINNVFVLSDDTIFVEYDDVSIRVKKGWDYVEKVWVEPVTGIEQRSYENIKDTKDAFYKQLLRDLVAEKIHRSQEKMGQDNWEGYLL